MAKYIYIVPLGFAQLGLIDKLKELGIEIVALDDNEANPYKEQVSRLVSTEFNAIKKVESEFREQGKECCGILGVISDFGIRKSHELSQLLGIKEIFSVKENIWLLDKFQYLQYFNGQADTCLPSEFKEHPKGDFIIKPRTGSGSRDIKTILQDFENEIQIKPDCDYLIQKKYFGKEYSVEGFINQGVVTIFAISIRKLKGFTATSISSIKTRSAVYKNLRLYLESKLSLIPAECTFPFHLEIIDDITAGYKIIDFSPRGGGFSLADFFVKNITGIDVNEAYAQYIANDTRLVFGKLMARLSIVLYVQFSPGIFKKISFNKAILSPKDRFVELIKEGTRMNKPINDSHRIAYFTLSDDTDLLLKRKIKLLKESIVVEIQKITK